MKLDKKKVFVIMANRQMNLTQLQKKTGVSMPTIRYAVNGITNARPETAEKIAKALNVELTEIIA